MEKKIIRPLTKDIVISEVERDPRHFLRNEWLVTNGLGGYCSGTIIGVVTRKYHGLLVAALPPPLGRYIMLNHMAEEVIQNEESFYLNCEETAEGDLNLDALNYLKEFFLEDGLPVWRYHIKHAVIEKRIFMTHRQNSVYISYELVKGSEKTSIRLFPAVNFRGHEAPVNSPLESEYIVTVIGNKYEIGKKDLTPLRLFAFGDEAAGFTMQAKILRHVFFQKEMRRGYEYTGDLWNPGYFHLELKKNVPVGIVATTEPWSNVTALLPIEAHRAETLRRRLLLHFAKAPDEKTKELIHASEQFVIVPEHRMKDTVRAHAFGEEIRTVIAGYHWFTDWGRDTMISLEGLVLCTNRFKEARWILKTFAHYVKSGLIPNMFPEGKHDGLYNTADATLWFFHAIDRYLTINPDSVLFEEFLPVLEEIIDFHIKGTAFSIGIDEGDKLLKQGTDNFQLTWMDAKVGDWIVTPRRGKAVEINALWYNALKLMEEWSEGAKKESYGTLARSVCESFNKRFWIEDKGYLYDVVDGEKGNDDAFRPNQIFALSLKYPVLESTRWHSVVDKVKEKLLTPYGLRTLEMGHPDFKPNYEGDLRARDAAYHQGTVWPWLIGPFIDAWLKVYPDNKKEAGKFLEKFFEHLSEAGIGTISEIFDATPPFIPKGCIAQAWSVAEVLRTWLKVNS